MATENFKTNSTTHSYKNNRCILSGSIYVKDITGKITDITLYLGAYGGTVPNGGTITLHAYKNGSLIGPESGFNVSFDGSLSDGGDPRDWSPPDLDGTILNSGDNLELRISDKYTHDNICIVYDKCTITTDSSSGEDSDEGSGEDVTPSVSGSATFSKIGNKCSVRAELEIENAVVYQIDVCDDIYIIFNWKREYTSGPIEFSFDPGYGTFNLTAEALYRDSSGKTGRTNLSGSASLTFPPGELGQIAAPTVKTELGNNLVTPGETFTVSWAAPELNGNTISKYNLYYNNENVYSGSNKKSTVVNTLGEKQKGLLQVQAITTDSKTTSSEFTTLYNLTISAPQTYIQSDNSELTSDSAPLRWEPLTYSIADELSGQFNITYDLKYKTSSDKVVWGDITTIAQNLTEPNYTISEIGDYNLAGKFICFIIESKILYNGSLLKTITTDTVDGLIKYAGDKPNQLKYMTLSNTNKKGEFFETKYIYDNEQYIWETKDFKWITKNSILTVGFNELVTGYILPGVKLTWKKGKLEKSKEIPASAIDATTLSYSFDDEEFFTEEFWDSYSTNIIFTVTSSAYLQNIDSPVLEEKQGFFYRGIDFQPIQKPIIGVPEKITPITSTNRIIPVNFAIGNQEPIVDKDNHIYEDLRLINIQASHPQNVDIYGYKIYGAINNFWGNNWQQDNLINDELFNASYGGSYEEGMFIPTWEKGSDGVYKPTVNLELGILNEEKNKHLTSLLGSEISNYGEKININYRLTVVDAYGLESENYYPCNFYYDCRKPAIFNEPILIFSPTILETKPISPYGSSIETIPVFNGDNLTIKFYPAINPRHYNNNQNDYIVNGNKIYLKYSSDNSIIDPNYYTIYKFVKQPTGELLPNFITTIESVTQNSPLIKSSENINGEYVTCYYYQLNFNLTKEDIDEIEYFQIVPSYIEEKEGTRISRIYYYDNNDNGFNICYNNGNAVFWNSRINKPKIQVTGIERIATTKDNFGFTLPKLKLYVTDWGTTHQFVGKEKFNKDELVEFNRLTDLTYSINYYEEFINKNGETDKIRARKYIEIENETLNNILVNYDLSLEDFNNLNKTSYTDSDLENILNGKIKCELIPTLERKYLVGSQQEMDYDTLAAEYKDYYDNFKAMQDALEGSYITDYEGVEGTTKLPVVTSGTTLYINLPSPIKGVEESSTNFFAYLTITGNVKRVKVNADNTASFYNHPLQLTDYSIYISQNKKTFIIQQGKLGINQPDLNNIEESLYVIDKKQATKDNDTYPNILGLELDRIFNRNNGTTGAFIGFYDDSIKNSGERILMGSLGMGVELDENEKATYIPLVIYNEEAKGASIKVKLAPEAGAGIKIEGDYNNVISHKNSVEALETISLAKISYDSEGHITGKEDVGGAELREMSRIAYDVNSPEEEFFEYPLGEPQEGDIYIWVQSE